MTDIRTMPAAKHDVGCNTHLGARCSCNVELIGLRSFKKKALDLLERAYGTIEIEHGEDDELATEITTLLLETRSHDE